MFYLNNKLFKSTCSWKRFFPTSESVIQKVIKTLSIVKPIQSFIFNATNPLNANNESKSWYVQVFFTTYAII